MRSVYRTRVPLTLESVRSSFTGLRDEHPVRALTFLTDDRRDLVISILTHRTPTELVTAFVRALGGVRGDNRRGVLTDADLESFIGRRVLCDLRWYPSADHWRGRWEIHAYHPDEPSEAAPASADLVTVSRDALYAMFREYSSDSDDLIGWVEANESGSPPLDALEALLTAWSQMTARYGTASVPPEADTAFDTLSDYLERARP